MVYFPDLDEGQLPEKKYIFRVLSAQRPIQLTKLVKQARDNRAIENSSQDDMIIEMTADVKETILSLLPKKSKLLCCSYSSFQPAKVELISSKRRELSLDLIENQQQHKTLILSK